MRSFKLRVHHVFKAILFLFLFLTAWFSLKVLVAWSHWGQNKFSSSDSVLFFPYNIFNSLAFSMIQWMLAI